VTAGARARRDSWLLRWRGMSVHGRGREVASAGGDGLPLLANLSWAFIGNALYALTQWALLMILTKEFAPSEFGAYALALSIATPVLSTSSLQLRSIQVSTTGVELPFAGYLGLRLSTCGMAMVCLLALVLMGGVGGELCILILLLGLNQAIGLVKDIYQGVMQRHERMDRVAISNVLQGGGSVVTCGVVAVGTGSMRLVVLGMLLARLTVLVAYDLPQARKTVPVGGQLVTGDELRRALALARMGPLAYRGLPLGVMMALLALYPNVPRYFLAGYFGRAYVGYFAALATLMSVQELLTIPLGEAATRRLAVYYATDRASFVWLLARLMALGAVIGAVGVAVSVLGGGWCLAILFRPEYASFVNALSWLMVARLILNVQCFMSYGITAAGRYRAQAWIWGVGVSTMIAFCALLVPTCGAVGAAWAVVSSAMCATLASVFVIARALRT
jgi:O-antigen/teichoic acid export membrane protein